MDRTAQLVTSSTERSIAYDPPGSPPSLHTRAARVLEANWTGASTVPSRGLYPHQWSWDSAFIAIGLRHLSPLRAQTELETLLTAQWGDGRIPHIVFNPSVPLDAYFPSPDFWRSSTAGRTAGAPRTVQTSGIVQPPVHALAAWLVHRADPGLSRSRGFLARVYPRLAAWHRYLLHRRDLGGGGLASVVHPWEQGMDNSPAWDLPLSRVTPAPARSFRRADLDHGAAEDRPTDLDYGRYVRLAADYRDAGYRDEPSGGLGAGPGGGRGAGTGEFAVEDPAFNALLIASEHALARIADELGATGAARHARAERLTQALVERLWDPASGMFLCRDLRGPAPAGPAPVGHATAGHAPGGHATSGDRGSAFPPHRPDARPAAGHGAPAPNSAPDPAPDPGLIPERGVSGLVPLLLPGLPRDIVTALLRTAAGPHFGLGSSTRLLPSYDLLGEAFDAHRYWRGPAWFNTAWLVERGLRTHGERQQADALRESALELAAATDFAEYVDPYTGEGCGATGFSWTAALALDLLHGENAGDTTLTSETTLNGDATLTGGMTATHGTTITNSTTVTADMGFKGGNRR
ncbi:MGH1-like glycoside hydrolase domain-containing protein [Streptomyces griseorubiginosus]|uniref:MGH1-like glycoside hydrolase domain-containing protein n=1 Tax=Streptomyces griseorubiginosus TaxID=67304 RepID=UPI0033FE1428